MGFRRSSLLSLALFLALSSTIHAFDITKLLGQYPEFSSFNKYLTETKLADEINKRNTITVLAVDNGAISAISGKSPQAIKAIISTQVILDYFDEKKLMEAQGSGKPLTTLYQASGLATNQQGFIKVALVGEGEIAFGSAVSGAQTDSELVKTVTTQPYNVSILQISKPITFPGVDSSSSSNAQSPQGSKTPSQGAKAPAPTTQSAKAPLPSSQGAKAPAPAQNAKAPAQSAKAKAPAQNAKAPAAPAQSAKAPVPAKGTQAPTPSSSEVTAPTPSEDAAAAPEAETPVSSPSLAPASGPVGDEADLHLAALQGLR